MSVIICLRRGAERAAFLSDTVAHGVYLDPVPGLDRHFIWDGPSPEAFPLAGHPAVLAVEDGEVPVRPAAAQPISIDVNMSGGSWAIARHIRRDAPWLAGPRIRHPIETYFRAVRTGAGVDVYVVDSGIRYSHDEFGGRAVFVYGVYGSGGVDDHGHGSAVAACVGGASSGIAREAGLRIVKALSDANVGTTSGIAACIGAALSDYAARVGTNRPALINISIVASGTALAISEAVEDCIDAGMVVVACAGNDMSDAIPVPGSVADVICVGGIKANDTPYYTGGAGTNHGSRVDILAAAERVWVPSISADDAFGRWSGTSFAAPLVSGVVACMLQGKARLASRSQVQAVRAAVMANATTGRFSPQSQFPNSDLPDRILWMDPDAASEPIAGVP